MQGRLNLMTIIPFLTLKKIKNTINNHKVIIDVQQVVERVTKYCDDLNNDPSVHGTIQITYFY